MHIPGVDNVEADRLSLNDDLEWKRFYKICRYICIKGRDEFVCIQIKSST